MAKHAQPRLEYGGTLQTRIGGTVAPSTTNFSCALVSGGYISNATWYIPNALGSKLPDLSYGSTSCALVSVGRSRDMWPKTHFPPLNTEVHYQRVLVGGSPPSTKNFSCALVSGGYITNATGYVPNAVGSKLPDLSYGSTSCTLVSVGHSRDLSPKTHFPA